MGQQGSRVGTRSAHFLTRRKRRRSQAIEAGKLTVGFKERIPVGSTFILTMRKVGLLGERKRGKARGEVEGCKRKEESADQTHDFFHANGGRCDGGR
jgi:hypothetical protein